MATGTTYTESQMFLIRLQTLIIDGGTDLLRNIFDLKLQNSPLTVVLAAEKHTIKNLQSRKVITQTQYDQLYPKTAGQVPKSAEFDITLLVCLLRSLPSLGLNLNYTWNKPPQPADISIEADICRLKVSRNRIAHIASTNVFTPARFQTEWASIEQVLVRLNSAVGKPVTDLKQKINGFKNDPIDPLWEQRLQTINEQWQKMNDLGVEMLHIKTEVKRVYEVGQETNTNVKSLQKGVEKLKKHVKEVKQILYERKNTAEDSNQTVATRPLPVHMSHDTSPYHNIMSYQSQMDSQINQPPMPVASSHHHQAQRSVHTNPYESSINPYPHSLSFDTHQPSQEYTQTVLLAHPLHPILQSHMSHGHHIKMQGSAGGQLLSSVPQQSSGPTSFTYSIQAQTHQPPHMQPHIAMMPRPRPNEYPHLHSQFQRFHLPGLSHSDEAYCQLKTKLRKGLIEIYRSHHSKFHLSPILEVDNTAPFLQFYVMPNINIITLERAFGGGEDKKEPISDLGNVFYKERGPCREIYLTADAGFGKTSFSKRLALTWCQAKNPTEKDNHCLEKKEIRTMDEFDFVFLVFLRDSLEDDCHIIDMVLKQIVQEQLELETISREDLKLILDTERCLVILDGLDEWSHPENSCKKAKKHIPHRKANQCTVLTTTRPWKLSGDNIEAIHIDQKLEIAGLSEASANSLKKSMISHLCAGKAEQKRIDEFNKSVKEKKITNLIKNPIMLMYILCLFCENRELGKSLCMLYSNITDMLFCRTVKIHKKTITQSSQISQSEIPQCLKENKLCIQFYTLLAALGKLAFHTIFVETREENTLVFDNSVVDQFLNEDCLDFCLKTGILTRSYVRGKLTKQETKVSFAHKTVQEFFAALCSTTDPNSFQETVLSKCKCVKDILEMSNILKFVSGIDEKLSSSILTEVINIVNNDPVTHEYRSTLYSTCRLQLKEFQDLCISCCRDFTSEFQHNLCLQSVFITKSCQEEQYREHLKQLTTRNTQDIRSLHINMNDMYKTPYNTTQKVIDYFVLRDLVNIEKIHHRGNYNKSILPLLNSSVKSLSLWCGDSWSHLLFVKMTSLHTLEAIDISMFKMNHRELSLLLDYISQRYGMKEIVLANFSCTDSEKYSCTGHNVDLSQHFLLRKLVLDNLPLAQVVVNMSSLEKCGLQHLCNRDLVLKFENCRDCKLEEISCNHLKSSAAIDSFLDTLPLFHHVRKVQMWKIDLGTRNLTFSPQVKIKRLVLANVTMKASTMRELGELLRNLPQSVTVDIWNCTISPKKDFKAVKKQIKSMQGHFMILKDDKIRFEFRTIEDED